jgi:hypothetical protein
MRKCFVFLVSFLLLTSVAFAGLDNSGRNVPENARDISVANVTRASNGSANIPVATTGTVYTNSFKLNRGEYFETSYYAVSSAGTISLTIELEQSFQAPTTEGSADATYTEPVNMADIVTTLTTESTWYHKAISPVTLPYGRFKITGTGANNADTILNMKISQQKNG